MKEILLFGAGKSSTCLIDYLLSEVKKDDWHFMVCDGDLNLAQSKIGDAQNVKAVSINVENDNDRRFLIQSSDIVISLLPPTLHFLVAKDCVTFNKNLLTASYIDDNIRSLKNDIEKKGLFFLCETGLDPGIDHMSAMHLINAIKQKNGNILSFKSHCGGLIAPESDNNPWHYKITWNPRNIVLAGKDGAMYRENKKTINVPYINVFKNCKTVSVPGLDNLAWYPNRDSISYLSLYGLQEIPTFIRTTLRYSSFCNAWDKLVNFGFTDTDDFEKIKDCKTFSDWYNLKTDYFIQDNSAINPSDSSDKGYQNQLFYLGLKSSDILPLFTCSADILQYLIEKNLAIRHDDKDMIVMLHEIEYEIENKKYEIRSNLVVKGRDSLRTAMAKTVGLPLGIATKLILQNKINLQGLFIPTIAEIYLPVLAELEQHEIIFKETTHEL